MKVFISYSSVEYNKVIELYNVLRRNEFDCWMAPQSIPAGSDYGTEIPPAIKNCDAFVLVLSKASQESIWVPKELDKAIIARKEIIPFHIDNSDITEPFDFRLTNIQRIDAFNRVSEGYKSLIEKLKTIRDSFKNITVENVIVDDMSLQKKSVPHYKEVYFSELQSTGIDYVAEKIARRIIKGEYFRLELDNQILPLVNRIIVNRYEYKVERMAW